MTVDIYSFGYIRSGPPADRHGNGGGFVFDCRLLPNPGLKPGYMAYNGLDEIVCRELEALPGVQRFLGRVFALVDEVVESYLELGYGTLQVSFGCTGGQHRSVYCAEQLAGHLRERGVHASVTHTERGVYW